MNYTKMRLSGYVLLIAVMMCMTACNEDPESESTMGNWILTTPFKGARRASAIVFTIGNKAYVGLGYNGTDYFADLYEYDPELGFWQTKASFPGIGRERAVSFSAGGKGYVGLGYNRNLVTEELGDFWEYDPNTDTWTQLSDFGGTARYNAVGFCIGERCYVGTGNDGANNYNDFWEYEPSEDRWTEIASYPGQKREEALAFVLQGKGYICGGRNNGLYNIDFWEFDPEGRSWTKRTPDSSEEYYDEFTSAVQRYNAVAFTINEKAYIATGVPSGGSVDNTVWEYDPGTQIWTQKTSFEGSSRSLAVAFSINDRAFLGTGQSGSSRFDDMWEFRPNEQYNEDD
jgi:N-acetylneuraminic acid mutarotase